MNKLKNKTFLVICGLLSIFSLILLFIFNYQVFKKEENNINEAVVGISKISNSHFEKSQVNISDQNLPISIRTSYQT